MVVLRPISLVKTPPSVSMPSDSGVTSNSRTSVTSPASTPPYTHNTSVSMPSDSGVTSNSRTSVTSPASTPPYTHNTTRPCSASYVSWQRDTARSCCWASAVQQSINISCLLDPQQQTYHTLLKWWTDETDRWTLYTYTEPVAYVVSSDNQKSYMCPLI